MKIFFDLNSLHESYHNPFLYNLTGRQTDMAQRMKKGRSCKQLISYIKIFEYVCLCIKENIRSHITRIISKNFMENDNIIAQPVSKCTEGPPTCNDS
jgi:hypothetical protein